MKNNHQLLSIRSRSTKCDFLPTSQIRPVININRQESGICDQLCFLTSYSKIGAFFFQDISKSTRAFIATRVVNTFSFKLVMNFRYAMKLISMVLLMNINQSTAQEQFKYSQIIHEVDSSIYKGKYMLKNLQVGDTNLGFKLRVRNGEISKVKIWQIVGGIRRRIPPKINLDCNPPLCKTIEQWKCSDVDGFCVCICGNYINRRSN